MHGREVMEGEQAGILLLRRVRVFVDRPRGNAEDVALFPVEALAVDDRVAFALRALIDEAAGMAMSLGPFARPQELYARADRLHHRAAGHRIDVLHHHAVVGRTLGRVREFGQPFVGRLPFVFHQRRVGLRPGASRGQQTRRRIRLGGIVDCERHLLPEVWMDHEKVRLKRVHQRDVQPVLPDAGASIGRDAMLVPGAVGREHEVVAAERHLVAVDDRVGARALHDEAQRGSRVRMGGSGFAGVHHLQARVEPTDRRREFAPVRIAQVDHTAPRLLRRHE